MNPLNKILLGVGAALALIAVIAFVWLALANAHLKTRLAQTQANATACHLANDAFAAQAGRQNKAVADIAAAAAAHLRRAQHAADQARRQAQRYRFAIDGLRKQALRGDACHAADDLFNQFIAGRK